MRCAEKVGFGKTVKQEIIGGNPSHEKVMDGVEEKDIIYYTKFVGRPKMGPPRILAPHSQMSHWLSARISRKLYDQITSILCIALVSR